MTDHTKNEQNDGLEIWPFPDVPPELYYSLPEADRIRMAMIVRDLVDGANSKH